jgi:hypothetical protein
MEIHNIDIKNTLDIITSIGTFLSALAGLFTLLYIKKQTESQHKPIIVFNDFSSKMSKVPNNEYGNFYYWTGMPENAEFDIGKEWINLIPENIGVGVAKDIKIEWIFNQKKALKYLADKKEPEYALLKSHILFLKHIETNTERLFFHNIESGSISYLFKEESNEDEKYFSIPNGILSMFELHLIIYNDILNWLPKDEVIDYLYESFSKLPKVYFMISYRDINNKQYKKKYYLKIEFRTPYVPNGNYLGTLNFKFIEKKRFYFF